MKNFARISMLTVMLLALAGSASAITLPTNALVDIVEGIIIAEVTPLNFGVLVKNPGVVVIDALGVLDDTDAHLVITNTNISEGVFTVDSAIGAEIEVHCVAGASPPAGLALSLFTASWEGAAEAPAVLATPATHTMVAAQDNLGIGATLTVTGAVVVANAVDIPYDVVVVFQ
jgi:hypothetical protein